MTNEMPKFIHQILLDGEGGYNVSPSLKDHATSGVQVVWLHIDLSEPSAVSWLENESGLDNNIIGSMTVEETRPRAFKFKNGLLAVLRGVNLNPGNDPEDMVSIRVWLESNRIITVRRRPMVSIQDMIHDLELGEGPATPGEFFTQLIDQLANRIGDFVSTLGEELSDVEDNIETMEASELRNSLGSLRRQIATVRRYLAPQRDALDRMFLIESPLLSERNKASLREESDRVSRYLEDLDLARERAIVLQEAFLSQIAQQQNNRMYVLSIITAVFLPLGFVTGLFGINVGGMPGVDNPIAFWIICALLVVVSIGIIVVFRKMKWL